MLDSIFTPLYGFGQSPFQNREVSHLSPSMLHEPSNVVNPNEDVSPAVYDGATLDEIPLNSQMQKSRMTQRVDIVRDLEETAEAVKQKAKQAMPKKQPAPKKTPF